MEAFKALSQDLSSSLENNKSLSDEDHKLISLQLFLFEGVIEEFNFVCKERDDLRLKYRALLAKEKSKEVQAQSFKEEGAHVKNLQDTIKNLEKENIRLQEHQLELENLRNEHSSLLESIAELKKEIKVLGKKPLMPDILEPLSIDKLLSAERLSFLLPVNEKQSVWLQFRMEKQWFQCPICGNRISSRPSCICKSRVDSSGSSRQSAVYFQKKSSANVNHMTRNLMKIRKSCDFGRPECSRSTSLQDHVSSRDQLELHETQEELSSKKRHKIRSSETTSLDNMEVESVSTVSSGILADNIWERSLNSVELVANEKRHLMLKRSRFRGYKNIQASKPPHRRIKLCRHQRSKPVEGFSSLLFPKEDSKRLKQEISTTGTAGTTHPLNSFMSSLYY